MPQLIIIRGNSGSGKTTLAHRLQRALGRNTMVISQDVVRREMLWVNDDACNPSIELMSQLLCYGRVHCQVVILEGILNSRRYEPLFQVALEEFGKKSPHSTTISLLKRLLDAMRQNPIDLALAKQICADGGWRRIILI